MEGPPLFRQPCQHDFTRGRRTEKAGHLLNVAARTFAAMGEQPRSGLAASLLEAADDDLAQLDELLARLRAGWNADVENRRSFSHHDAGCTSAFR